MEQALQFNIVLLIAVPFLTVLFSKQGERAFNAIAAFWIVFCFSLVCWTIYVAAHFIGKYW